MIRPFTFVALLLAAASGLYLYQTKHRAELLDAKIGQTLRQVAASRERTGMLHAEWAWLNEPERLGQLVAAQHLDLQPLGPSRYATFADLAARVPPATPPILLAASPAAAPTPALADDPAPAPTAPNPSPRPVPVAAAPHPAPPRPAVLAAAPARPASAMRASAAEPVAAMPVRSPAIAPAVLSGLATPMAHTAAATSAPLLTRTGAVIAQPQIPAVASALGGYGRPPLAPPVPFNGN